MRLPEPNIILITIDSLRFDHLGCYGYARDTSPNIDSLASGGVLFLQALSNGGNTPDAFPAILASVLPVMGKERELSQPRTTLAEQLKEVGYQTAAFHSNPFLSRYYGYSRGFDVFNDSLGEYSLFKGRLWMRTMARRQHGLMARALIKLARILRPVFLRVVRRPIVTAEGITKQALAWLKENNDGFFLWLHYMDVHHPYLPLPEYLGKFRDQTVSRRKMAGLYRKMLKDPGEISPLELATLIDLYDADIRYVDDCIGSLLDSLGEELADTVVIVTADHGDEFGEHGRYGHQSLHDGIVRVPLIMAGPGIKGGTVVKHQVSLIDLAPTITDLVGLDSVTHFQGQSLLPVIKGQESAARGTISILNKSDLGRRYMAYRTPEWKYIRTESLDEANSVLSEELYDLRNDPQERHNLHGSEEARAFELEAVNRILEFKQLKREAKTANEMERIRARARQLKGSGKI